LRRGGAGRLVLLRVPLLLALAAAAFSGCGGGAAGQSEVVLATSTSPLDSGLLAALIPAFEARYPYRVRVEPLGSGLALQALLDGECDVTLTHSPLDEQQALSGFLAVDRRAVMHNRYVIVGPPEDPAGIRGLKDPNEAFRRIMESRSSFLSRGDGSGTHAAEQQAWLSITGYSQPQAASWYLAAGKGMADTLLQAGETGAYTLCDLAVWLVYRQRCGLEMLVGPEGRMANPYVVMRTNPEAFPDVNEEGARCFEDFITGEEAQRIIEGFGVEEYGQPLYYPDAL
jgi:tungstate transport system substrate-binding protein